MDSNYIHIAQALARGYTDLYYVNMDSDEFIEFHTDDKDGVLKEARRGTDFFEGCERDARLFVHEGFNVDNRSVLLDLHCGALRVDGFDIDSQTVYACLNYADEESKLRQQRDMVEFRNDLNEENHSWMRRQSS